MQEKFSERTVASSCRQRQSDKLPSAGHLCQLRSPLKVSRNNLLVLGRENFSVSLSCAKKFLQDLISNGTCTLQNPHQVIKTFSSFPPNSAGSVSRRTFFRNGYQGDSSQFSLSQANTFVPMKKS